MKSYLFKNIRINLLKNKKRAKLILLLTFALFTCSIVFILNGIGSSKAADVQKLNYWLKFNKDAVLLDSKDASNNKVLCKIDKNDTLFVYDITETSTDNSETKYWYHVRYCGDAHNITDYGKEGYVLVDFFDIFILEHWGNAVSNTLTDVTGYYQIHSGKRPDGKRRGSNWCGAAATKSVVQHFTDSNTIEYYAKSYGIYDYGATSEQQILDMLNSYEAITKNHRYLCTYDSNKRILIDKLKLSIEAGSPVIVLVNTKDNKREADWGYATGGHYVTVSGYDDCTGTVTICDSASSKRIRQVSIELLADCLKAKKNEEHNYDYYTLIYSCDL